MAAPRICCTAIALIFASCASKSSFRTDLAAKTSDPASTVQDQVAAPATWPREFRHPEASITVYQPQPESFVGATLTGRSAVSVVPAGQEEPIFGCVWFSARVAVDRDARTVEILDVKVARAHLPEAKPDKIQKFSKLLAKEMPRGDLALSLDELTATLETAEREQRKPLVLDTSPPKVVVTNQPAVLVSIDGEPQLRPVDGAPLMRVINTPFLILLHSSGTTYYLRAGRAWFAASKLGGSWKYSELVPAEVVAAAKKLVPDDEKKGEAEPVDKKLRVVVATEPTELISIDGEPKYTPITGTDLLAISNTETFVFMEIRQQRYFIVVSGRWFTAPKLAGPWTYVPAEKLPADFAKIPEKSRYGEVLAHVPGTDVAKDAVLDTYVPQTATIERTRTITVTYDGAPVFQRIEGTNMSYAHNSPFSVIRVGRKYHCCHEAIWYEADSARGPWAVSVAIPVEIYAIPANCPVHHVTYVRVYGSTPKVVYVGYTMGYVGCYVYGGTVVYGTGYVYPVYVGTVVYYPRPVTYGYTVVYRRSRGWAFAAGFVAGAWVSSRWGGWYGGRRGRVDINVHRNIYHVGRGGRRPGGRPGAGPGRGRAPGRAAPGRRPGNRGRKPNNVYADRNGNVHRRTGKGWESRRDGKWGSARGATAKRSRSGGARPGGGRTERRPGTGSSRGGLDRDHSARQRGSSRRRSSGGRRGGGGRR